MIRDYISININNKVSLRVNDPNDKPKHKGKIKNDLDAKKMIKSIKSNKELISQIDRKLLNRRSTMEFQVIEASQKSKKKKPRKKYITCTLFEKDNLKEFKRMVKTLGEFFLEFSVTEKTTHLVVPYCVRTLNVLRAIARGCWIVKENWIRDSMKHGAWLSEEEYELNEFSPAVQQCRLQRRLFGSSFTIDVFHNCGAIFISRTSKPKCNHLQELVKLCKGKVVNTSSRAALIVGEYVRDENVICVGENWILDSVMHNKKMDMESYVIRRLSSPTL